jgi:hypothetical protein
MKRLRINPNTSTRKTVCTVSAAALMLGVSHAASIGFNLQVDYCGATAAYRNNVTATAFGIPASNWENLTPMMTGFGEAPCDQFAYTLNQVISTNTSTGGLNPLPNGSLTINWNTPTANWSFFGGYSRPAPYYEIAGSAVIPGEEEVYAGFLRDGINFGPPNGEPNNPLHLAPYNIDIIGLKSLFTNTPFVVQLIASSDSMYHLTNAFIIDSVAGSTQSVTYPNPSRPRDIGDAPWIRGYGGGLSTVSTNLDTDHIKLIGNFPQHSASPNADKTNSINNASTVAGFIITDKPVITMSPRSVVAVSNDTVLLRTIAAGVPPLSYQWRKSNVPIPSETNSVLGITNIASLAFYDVIVSNAYGSATSKLAIVTLDRLAITRGPGSTTNTITWQFSGAVLQSADTLNGPYVDISPVAVSPYRARITATPKFYRYRRDSTIVQSNPYDM